MNRTSVIRITIYLSLIAIGLVLLAWPEENDQMMIRFSETHGPSVPDLVGLTIIFIGYLPLVVSVFREFSGIQRFVGRVTAQLLVAATLGCSIAIGIALAINSELLLWSSVTISTLAQAVLVYSSFRVRLDKAKSSPLRGDTRL